MATGYFSGKTTGKNQGFSLVELSVVLLVIGLMIGGIMSVMVQEARLTKQNSLKKKMDTIEQAMVSYVKRNNRLPCPADGTYLITNSYFGIEGGTAGDGTCSTGASYTYGNRTSNPQPPTANFYITNLAGGVVPVRTLGLPDEYAFDPWGGRFNYAVDNRITAENSLNSTYFPNYSATSITVMDSSENNLTTSSIAVIYSNGVNGHGAFQLSGLRKKASSNNPRELMNCHCNSGSEAVDYINTFVMGTSSSANSSDIRSGFDDTLRYYNRGNFLTSSDIITEKTR